MTPKGEGAPAAGARAAPDRGAAPARGRAPRRRTASPREVSPAWRDLAVVELLYGSGLRVAGALRPPGDDVDLERVGSR